MEAEAYHELGRFEAMHWWYQGMRNISRQLLASVGDSETQLRVLDAGCGAGGNLSTLERMGYVVGFDFSPLALSYARRQHIGRITHADVLSIPFANDTFDLVTSFDVIYMVEDDHRAIREFARVTRPGGTVLIRVAAMDALRGSHDHVVRGVRRYSESQLREGLDQAGLTPLRMTYANSLLLPLIYVMRKIQNWQVKRGAAMHSDVDMPSSFVNGVFTRVLNLEAAWVGSGRRFPAGVSLFALAQKPGA